MNTPEQPKLSENTRVAVKNILIGLNGMDVRGVLDESLLLQTRPECQDTEHPLRGKLDRFLGSVGRIPQIRSGAKDWVAKLSPYVAVDLFNALQIGHEELYAAIAGGRNLKPLEGGEWMELDGIEFQTMGDEEARYPIPNKYDPEEVKERVGLVGRWNGNDRRVFFVRADGTLCMGMATPENLEALKAANYFKNSMVQAPVWEGAYPKDPEVRRAYEAFIQKKTEEDFTLNPEERQKYDQVVTRMRELFSSIPRDFYPQRDNLQEQLDEILKIPPQLRQTAAKEARERTYSVIRGYLTAFLENDFRNTTANLDRLFSGQPETIQSAYQRYKEAFQAARREEKQTIKVEDPVRDEFEDSVRSQIGIRSLAKVREQSREINTLESELVEMVKNSHSTPQEIRQALIKHREEYIKAYESDTKEFTAINKFYEQAAEETGLKVKAGIYGYTLVEATPPAGPSPADADAAEREAKEAARQQALDRVRSYAQQEGISLEEAFRKLESMDDEEGF